MKKKAQKNNVLASLLRFEAKAWKRGRSSMGIIIPKPIALNWEITPGDKIPIRVLLDGNVLLEFSRLKKKLGRK
jgi:hypothetical protein